MAALSKEEEPKEVVRWGAGHYHALVVLFICYAVGMLGKGTMSLAIFGMSKDAALGFSATDVASVSGGERLRLPRRLTPGVRAAAAGARFPGLHSGETGRRADL